MSSTKPFHLAWFLSRGYGPKAWRHEWGGNASRWMMPDLFQDLARSLERACFDYVMIEDSSNIPYTYKNSHNTYLKYGAATPKLDPAVLVPYLAQVTKKLGVVATLSTSEYPPYLLARLVNSLDHTTEGRVGWNIVTGSNDGAAQNYGKPKHAEHDLRYDMADEFTQIVTQLWDSWEPDAIKIDLETTTFADGDKVHPINFEGQYFSSRGPLISPRSPQGRPVICQAGGSPRGQRFAAKWADTIIGRASNIAEMKSFRANIRTYAAEAGRNPDDIKVLFLASPLVDSTMEEAKARRQRILAEEQEHMDFALAMISYSSGIDFSTYPLDEPLPALTTNGHQSIVARYAGKTPRQVALDIFVRSEIDMTGTSDYVAGLMGEVIEEVGGDGFLLFNGDFTRRYIAEITDGLVPELQRRGLTRTGYAHDTFRANLMDF